MQPALSAPWPVCGIGGELGGGVLAQGLGGWSLGGGGDCPFGPSNAIGCGIRPQVYPKICRCPKPLTSPHHGPSVNTNPLQSQPQTSGLEHQRMLFSVVAGRGMGWIALFTGGWIPRPAPVAAGFGPGPFWGQ